MSQTAPPDLLTPSQVAKLLNVTPTTVTNWARSGRLASVVLPSGHRRYRRSDIDAMVAAAEPQPA